MSRITLFLPLLIGLLYDSDWAQCAEVAVIARRGERGNSQAAPHFWPPAVSAGGFQFGMIPVCSSFDSLLFGRSLRLAVLRAEKRAKKDPMRVDGGLTW